MAPSSPSPPALQEATRNATATWQDDLQSLFRNAKDRFPDVVWELLHGEDANGGDAEEVWGHKAVVYARAPPTFQARYFSFRPPPATSPHPYSASPATLPAQSSLSLAVDFGTTSRSPSPFRVPSPSPSTTPGTLLRLPTSINPTLFSNELEYLYTGKGLGAAFEFLFDTPESREEGDAEDARIDKLRKDLVFMWRSRLYSDVRIALTGNFSSSNHDSTTAIFSSHRFILVSRSPYFHTQLLSWGVHAQKPLEPLTLNLPSPPFTPASLHFTLGFIYTGTLIFSHRTFDLDTGFQIMRSAAYLSLDTLYDEIQARIVQEMMHGLFHAFLEFAEYERITGGKWGTGGCRCRQCSRRAPRVLEFALADDVKNPHLERGARRALVGLFGEGWCTPEFAQLPQKIREGIVKGLAKRTTPINVFPLLFAAQAAMNKLNGVGDSWAVVSRDMVMEARKTIDNVLCAQPDTCFEQPEWMTIMEADGVQFEDGEKVEWIMESIRRGLNETNAGTVYQTLVSSILIRPHPTESDETMLSSTSHVRVQVELAKSDVVRWLRRRWLSVKQQGGFDTLEDWAAKEISHEIDVGVEDLFSPVPTTPTQKTTSTRRPSKTDETETGSMHSMRTSVLNRHVAQHMASQSGETVRSSSHSVRSVAHSTHSTISRHTTTNLNRRLAVSPGLRPDSKLTPGQASSVSTKSSSIEGALKSPTPKPSVSSINTRRTVASTLSPDVARRPKSSTSSVTSTRSSVATIRKPTAGPSTLRPTSGLSRPMSNLSSTSDGSTTFETARSDVSPSTLSPSMLSTARTRKASTVSMSSTLSTKTTATSTPKFAKSRPSSAASKTPPTHTKRPPLSLDVPKPPVITQRVSSSTSVRSTLSTTSATAKKVASRRTPVTPLPPSAPQAKDKLKSRVATVIAHEKQSSNASSSSASTVKESLKRKSSSATITESTVTDPLQNVAGVPRGATLDIGIPCIISSKRARFRAYARYIGEVEGEAGPWVGVEVPLNDSWQGDKLDGRQWNDGSWGGIRYFDIGSPSEWEYEEDRAARRRRVDWTSNLGKDSKLSLKREGDQLSIDRSKRFRSESPAVSDISNSESRGLFVRPQQVLYVVDAVGSDL